MKETLTIEKLNTIEQQANSQEHPSLLLFSRLENPEIFEQLVSLYENYYKQKKDFERVSKIKGKNPEELREIIREEINNRIKVIKNDTLITNNLEIGGSDCGSCDLFGYVGYDAYPENSREQIQINKDAYLDFLDRFDMKKWKRVQSIIESHEKGHFIRNFSNGFFDELFFQGFDTSVFLSPSDKSNIGFNANEIAERMSQLKAYFGMKGNEKFTLEHLAYAREHYVYDTGTDNHMSETLSLITKEKESKFIELINSSGI